MEDLNDTFKQIAQQTSLDAKFCFFIDRLDEYDGEEKYIIKLIQELSISRYIKICASSRSRRQYESFLRGYGRPFDIAYHTKEDIRRSFNPYRYTLLSLLEKERKNSDYAVDALIKPMFEAEVEPGYAASQDRIRNRCSHLLIVDDKPHPVFLSCSVNFLHRNVRDFLRDYDKQLKRCLGKVFDPLASLSKICLSLLKALPIVNIRNEDSAHKVIGLTDELLYYARKVEKKKILLEETPLVGILDELDKVNSYHTRDIIN
ncbi:hypothetical protein E0Z10_g9987 [Xylaria hypoxylon]|uniref:DUF7791 domain-containing protein n=1 Tax=Xylaria hypoxylon TaxID=37992 RepID=A0A4Z0YQB9_9PEZI|nr:hypothetical protein E0Z10_g9987 [Xylaria hypoxylon]